METIQSETAERRNGQQLEPSSLGAFLQVLSRHRTGVILIFLLVAGGVAVYTFVQTPVYEVDSSVMIRYGREYVYRPVNDVEAGEVQPMRWYHPEEIINTEIEILRSKALIRDVIREVGLAKLYPRLAEKSLAAEALLTMATDRFAKKLDVSHVKKSSVIGLTFLHQDPQIAVQALRRLVELFKERHLQVFRNPRTAFLEQQVAASHERLLAAEKKLQQFKRENGIYAAADQKALLVRQYVDLETRLLTGRNREQALQQKVASLEGSLQSLPEDVSIYSEEGRLKKEGGAMQTLLNLQLQEQQLLEKYTEDNRRVKAVRREIELVNDFLATQEGNRRRTTRVGRSVVYQQTERDLLAARTEFATARAGNEALEHRLQELRQKLEKLDQAEIALKDLQREVETSERNYRTFRDKLDNTRIEDAMDQQKMVNVVVVEQPLVPMKPARPVKRLNLFIGLILGLTCGVAYAFVAEYQGVGAADRRRQALSA
ncbi:GumC family protein [Thermodesulfobacteriota bacterium B35]